MPADKRNDNLSPVDEFPASGATKLYILFGDIKAGVGLPPFEFYKAADILNEHKLFVRDFSQSWYHCGLPGISKDILGTRDFLAERIRHYAPEETILIGNSMGGFAAILFASLLSNCRAIAISPQTYISPQKRFQHGDHRFGSPIRKTYLKALLKKKYYDLAKLEAGNSNWQADLIVSAHHTRDCSHAINVEQLPQIRVHRFDCNNHDLVKELRDRKILGEILQNRIPPANERGVIDLSTPEL